MIINYMTTNQLNSTVVINNSFDFQVNEKVFRNYKLTQYLHKSRLFTIMIILIIVAYKYVAQL